MPPAPLSNASRFDPRFNRQNSAFCTNGIPVVLRGRGGIGIERPLKVGHVENDVYG
jgi:hypothetical protein